MVKRPSKKFAVKWPAVFIIGWIITLGGDSSGRLVLLAQESPSTETQVVRSTTPPEIPETVVTDDPTEIATEPASPTVTELPTNNPPTTATEPLSEATPEITLPVPTNTPEATLTESVTDVIEGTAVPTTAALPAEPQWVPLLEDHFDTEELSNWLLGPNWSLTAEDQLQVTQSDEPVQLQTDDLYNVAIQSQFRLAGGSAQLTFRQSSVGRYVAVVDANGQVNLYRGDTLLQSAPSSLNTIDQWFTLRVSAVEDVIRLALNEEELIALQDPAPLPPGAITISAQFAEIADSNTAQPWMQIDDVQVWIPADSPSVPSPTASDLPTATETLASTEAVIPDEPAMTLLVADNFDSGELYLWSAGAGWTITPNGEGQALQAADGGEPLSFAHDNLFNHAAQLRFRMNTGVMHFSIRQSSVGSYSARLHADGQVDLYRGEGLIASADGAPLANGQWHMLRVSTVDDIVRLSIDSVGIIELRDAAPLPPGSITIIGESGLLIDDFELWLPSHELPETLQITPTLTATPQEPVLAQITADDFNRGQLVNWNTGAGWSLVESEGGYALAVSNSQEQSAYDLEAWRDVVAQIRFYSDTSPIELGIRQTETEGYTARFTADRQVQLYRNNAVFATTTLSQNILGQWHTVQFSAIENNLRILMDGELVLETSDPQPLPAGSITLAAPETVTNLENEAQFITVLFDDFELWQPAVLDQAAVAAVANTTLGGEVWLDLDYDGFQDAGDTRLANVTVNLWEYNLSTGKSAKRQTKKTNASGAYSFSAAGNRYYFIEVIRPSGYDFTTRTGSISSFTNSDVDPFTGRTDIYSRSAGFSYLYYDAGLVELYDCDIPIDLVIVVDGSGSISASNFNNIKSFARGLVNSFSVRPGSAHVGLVQFAIRGTARTQSNLTSSRSGILTAINGMTQIGGGTSIDEGLELGQHHLTSRGRGAPIPRAIVLLTDGQQDPPDVGNPIGEAARIRNTGAVIYVVGIGSYNAAMVNGIASDPDNAHVFPVSGLPQLVSALYNLANATCATPIRPVAPKLTLPPDKHPTNDTAPTTFGWATIVNATSYELQIDNDKLFGSPLDSFLPSSNSLTMLLNLTEGTWYWRVRGLNGSVPGAWSIPRSIIVDKTPPNKPVLSKPLNMVGVFNYRPTVSWNATATANLYQVQIATDDAFANIIASATTASRSYRPPTNQPFGRYYWRVQARDAAGNWSMWSSVWSFDITIMRTPINSSWTTDTTPKFDWYKLTGATGYELEVATDADFELADMVIKWAALNAITHTVPNTNPLPFGKYYWRVNIDRGTGTFEQSPIYWELTITPKPPTAPKLAAPPNNVFLNDTTPEFTWETVTDAVKYEIQISTSSNFALLAQSAAETDLNYTALTLLNGKYFWRVRALNYLDVPSVWSQVRSFTVDTVVPDAPTLISPVSSTTTTDTTPTFKWKSVSGAVRYEMQLDTTTPRYTVYVDRATSYTPSSPLLRDRWHYWRVRAIDAAGNVSAWSSLWIVGILSPNNDAPVLNRNTTATPTLAWTFITWAAEYEIQIDDDNRFRSPNYQSGSIPASNLTHTLSTALPNGTWYWRIRARNGSGAYGNWSTVGSFTVEA